MVCERGFHQELGFEAKERVINVHPGEGPQWTETNDGKQLLQAEGLENEGSSGIDTRKPFERRGLDKAVICPGLPVNSKSSYPLDIRIDRPVILAGPRRTAGGIGLRGRRQIMLRGDLSKLGWGSRSPENRNSRAPKSETSLRSWGLVELPVSQRVGRRNRFGKMGQENEGGAIRGGHLQVSRAVSRVESPDEDKIVVGKAEKSGHETEDPADSRGEADSIAREDSDPLVGGVIRAEEHVAIGRGGGPPQPLD